MLVENNNLGKRDIDALELAVAQLKRGEGRQALLICNRMARAHGDDPAVLKRCSQIAVHLNAIESGVQWMRQAISIKGADDRDWFYLATLYDRLGKVEPALHCYRQAVLVNPRNERACLGLGTCYGKIADFGQSIKYLSMASEVDPSNPETHYNLGLAFSLSGTPDKAIASYRRAIAIKADFSTAHYNLGLALLDRNELELASQSMLDAAKGEEVRWQALSNLCLINREMGRFGDAVRFGKMAVRNNPQSFQAWHNLANAMKDLGQYRQALSFYERAIDLNAMLTDAHLGKGVALKRMGEHQAAAASFETALRIQPNSGTALCNLLEIHMMACDWKSAAEAGRRLDRLTHEAIESGSGMEEVPFINLTRQNDASVHLSVASAWSKQWESKASAIRNQAPRPLFPLRADSRLTVGYLSNNFRDHPTAHLTHGLFKCHDRKRFHVAAISYGPDDGSAWRKEIERTCDRFVDISMVPDVEAAKMIGDQKVDILVDLVGYLQGARPLIPALQPAPIQIRWLGMPGTTGANYYHYLLTDRFVTPPSQQRFYSERFFYLPHCYQINAAPPNISQNGMQRADHGLPEDVFVYCCFNTNYKIDERIFNVWMNLLKRELHSVLWLMANSSRTKENLIREASARGVEANRLIFAEKIPRSDHLKRLTLADLYLDTMRVSGAASASDALQVGTPVLSIAGSTFASRMAASIVTTAGLPDMAVDSLEQYEKLAYEMAADEAFCQSVKQRLKGFLGTGPLFDTRGFVRNLENAYLEMRERIQIVDEANA